MIDMYYNLCITFTDLISTKQKPIHRGNDDLENNNIKCNELFSFIKTYRDNSNFHKETLFMEATLKGVMHTLW